MALTDREFWINYWESHREDVMVPVPDSNLFTPLFEEYFRQKKIKTTCELGGFPGSFSVYLKRRYGADATLVDYVIHKEILKDFLKTNGLTENDLRIVEADIFSSVPETTYDLVFSIGLIEHFENTKEIISLHLKYMHPGSELVIILPNFTGLNGWFQRKFDIENYNKHVIECMDPALLLRVVNELGLKETRAFYLGKFGVWLEREHEKPLFARLLKKAVWFTGKVFSKIVPVDSRAFSPYIVVTGKLP